MIVAAPLLLLAVFAAGSASAPPPKETPASAPATATKTSSTAPSSKTPGVPPVFRRPRLLVWGFVPDGVAPDVATTVAAAVTHWAGRNSHVDTIGAAELKSLTSIEANRQAMGLPDSGRLAAIADAVDASLVLFGQVARDGDSHIVNLQLFQADQARAIVREKAVVQDLARAEQFVGRAANVLVARVLDVPAPDERTAARALVQALPTSLFAPSSASTPGADSARVAPFVVAGTEQSSRFGEQFARAFDEAVQARRATDKTSLRDDVVVRGSFRENADMIELAVVIDDPRAPGATPPVRAQQRLVRYVVDNAALIPQLVGDARRAADEAAAAGAQTLRLDAWTEKGRYDVAFVEGETFHVYLKMNQPGFVRLVYHLVDGTPVLMEDAWPVPPDRVGAVLRYQQDFGPAAPYGVERIEAIAFPRRPPPLPTKRQVIEGNAFDVVVNAHERGFVVAPESKVDIEITTSPR